MQNKPIKPIRGLFITKAFRKTIIAGILSSIALTSPMAFASIKDGVDAWSRGDYDEAVTQWRPEALKGDADAQFNMGQAYKLGRGVDANLDTALSWYKQAADQGHLQAGDSYGHLLHYQGKVSEAVPFLERSAERGEPRSQYLFATELFNGTNAPKDWVRAYALMTRASSSGLGPASRSLAQMDRFIPLNQRQEGIALAGRLEQSERSNKAQQLAGFNLDSSPAAAVAKPVTLPPSQIPAAQAKVAAASNSAPPSDFGPISANPGAPFAGNGSAVAATSPPIPVRRPALQPATSRPAANGNFRIQLGAFGKQDSAKTLWTNLEGRVGELRSIQPYLVPTGNVTRLQAGPFATRSDANAMCAKIKATGQGCFSLEQ